MQHLSSTDPQTITPRERALVCALLLGALAVRVVALESLPPGLRWDELINAMSTQRVLDGGPVVYFSDGWGREPLFQHAAAVLWRLLGPSVWAFRLTAAFFGVLGAAAGWRLARRLFGRTVALLTGVWLSFGFVPVYFGRQGLRAIALPFLMTLAVLALWHGLSRARRDRRAWIAFAVGGALLGLTLLTYMASRVVPMALLAFVAYLALFHRPVIRRHWPGLALYFGLAAAIAAPMFAFIRANPTAEQRLWHLQSVTGPASRGDFNPLIASVRNTVLMFISHGDPFPLYNIPYQPYFPLPVALLFFAGLALALWRWRQPAYVLILLLLGTGLVPSLLSSPEPSFVRALGIVPVVFIFPAVALDALGRLLLARAPRRRLPTIAVAALLLVLFSAQQLRVYFIDWAAQPELAQEYAPDMLALANRLELAALVRAQASAYAVSLPGTTSQTPWDGYHLDLLLSAGLPLRAFDGNRALMLPAERESVTFVATGDAPIGAVAPWPVTATGSADTIPAVVQAPTRPLDALAADLEALAPLTFDVALEETIALERASSAADRYAPGDAIVLDAVWRIEARPAEPLLIYAHLLDANGAWIAGDDRLDAAAVDWAPGDRLLQRHVLFIPPEAAPGMYRVTVGLYTAADGRRLLSADGRDAVVVHTIEVGP